MLDHPSKNGHSNSHSNAGLVVEDKQKQAFLVHRKVFVSPDILEREPRIFDKCWIYVGHASEVKNPGDFRTRRVAGPSCLLRDHKGEVYASSTLPPSRRAGMRERSGNARRFYCVYHGWTYNKDGALKHVPGEEAYTSAFDKTRKGADAVARLESYRDFWFSNFDPDARGSVDYLGTRRTISTSCSISLPRAHGDLLRRSGIRGQGELEADGR